MSSETQQRHYARSSVTNVLSLEQNTPPPTSLSKLLEIHEINFEENWRYRILSKLETLFHVTNVTIFLIETAASGWGSRCSNESTFVTDDLVWCRCCVSLVTRCAFDVHLAVGTTRRPTKHGFSGIPVRFLSLMWERRASLEKTLSLNTVVD